MGLITPMAIINLMRGLGSKTFIFLSIIFRIKKVGITVLIVGILLANALVVGVVEKDFTPLKNEGKRLLRIDAFVFDKVVELEENEWVIPGYDASTKFFSRFKKVFGYYFDLVAALWVYGAYFYVVWWLFNSSPVSPNTSGRMFWFVITLIVFFGLQTWLNYYDVRSVPVLSVGEAVWRLVPVKGLITFFGNLQHILYPFIQIVEPMIETKV